MAKDVDTGQEVKSGQDNNLKENSNGTKHEVNPEHLLEEYRTLREEILKRQEARTKTIQFTIAALAAVIGILGIFLKFNPLNSPSFDLGMISLFVSIFALTIIDAALILTIEHTQQNRIIAAYIREFIETETDLRWETRLRKYRELFAKRSKMGTGKAISGFYLLLLTVFLLISFSFMAPFLFTVLSFSLNGVLFLIFLGFLLYSLHLIRILYTRRTKTYWEELREMEESKQKE